MSDLIKILRGQHIDRRSTDEIMCLATDGRPACSPAHWLVEQQAEIERLRGEVIAANKAIEEMAVALGKQRTASQPSAAAEIKRLQRVLQKIMARCADLLDEDQFNELDAMTRATVPTDAAP